MTVCCRCSKYCDRFYVLFKRAGDPQPLHPTPTRRSSNLKTKAKGGGGEEGGGEEGGERGGGEGGGRGGRGRD